MNLQDNCLNNFGLSFVDEFRVENIEIINILGEDRKVIYFDFYQNGNQEDLDGEEEIWIEGIGSTGAIGP